MNQNILILSLLFVLSSCDDIFYLSLHKLITGNHKYQISLINRRPGISDKDLFYSGPVEYLENIIINAFYNKNKYESIRNEKHPLVFMFGVCQFDYINYFSPETVFVVDKKCVNSSETYSDYTIFSSYDGSPYFYYIIDRGDFFYIKIGKELEKSMKIFFYIIIGISILISIFLSFIMKRVLKNMDENNFY